MISFICFITPVSLLSLTNMDIQLAEKEVVKDSKVDVDPTMDLKDVKMFHLEKMSQYKTYAKVTLSSPWTMEN